MDINEINLMLKNIISFKINNEELDLTKIEIKKFCGNQTWYKNNQENLKYHVFYNGSKINQSSVLFVKYKCITCNEICELNSYKRLITKLNKQTGKYCVHCVQKYDNEMKKWRHDNLIGIKRNERQPFQKNNIEIKKLSGDEIYNLLSQQQKKQYWNKHYTLNEFNDLIKQMNIKFINDINILDIEYIPIYPTNNQQKITSCIKYKNKYLCINKVTCQCINCKKLFNIHWHKRQFVTKKYKQALCRQCISSTIFCNTTWKIKTTKNINGDKILYQSKYEKQFIDFCNENKILIYNGPTLSYFWNNKEHTYYVDFYVPKLNIIIELKAMHRFHKEQLKNGKWQAKEAAAKLAVEYNKFKNFILLYQDNFTDEWKENFKINYNKIQSDL